MNYMLVMVPTFVMPFSITLNPRMIDPRMLPPRGGSMNASWFLIQTKRAVPKHSHSLESCNYMGKCVKCLDTLHRCTCLAAMYSFMHSDT